MRTAWLLTAALTLAVGCKSQDTQSSTNALAGRNDTAGTTGRAAPSGSSSTTAERIEVAPADKNAAAANPSDKNAMGGTTATAGNDQQSLTGTINRTTTTQIWVDPGGKPLAVDQMTVVTLDGQPSAVDQLPKGADVRAAFRGTDGKDHATKIEVTSKK